MADEPEVEEEGVEPPKKKSKALLFGLVGAVLLGGGAFYAVFSGLIPLGGGEEPIVAEHGAGESGQGGTDHAYPHSAGAAVEFLPLEPMIISLGPNARSKHLKLTVQIEVLQGSLGGVQAVQPRITDILNTYLRAVDESDFELPQAMLRLRAQMLRRVQLVTPEGAVQDVLIQEFVLN